MEIHIPSLSTPDKKTSLEIYENGEYWINAKIRVDENTSNAFQHN